MTRDMTRRTPVVALALSLGTTMAMGLACTGLSDRHTGSRATARDPQGQAHAEPYEWHTSPDKWKEPRVFHRAFVEDRGGNRIKVGRNTVSTSPDDKTLSPNNAYWFALAKPDTTKPGPWNTAVFIFNERDYVIRIDLLDHGYDPTVKWINEKLLYIQVWWGRVAGSALIFDVEKEDFIYKEMVFDGVIPFQQWQQTVKGK